MKQKLEKLIARINTFGVLDVEDDLIMILFRLLDLFLVTRNIS